MQCINEPHLFCYLSKCYCDLLDYSTTHFYGSQTLLSLASLALPALGTKLQQVGISVQYSCVHIAGKDMLH